MSSKPTSYCVVFLLAGFISACSSSSNPNPAGPSGNTSPPSGNTAPPSGSFPGKTGTVTVTVNPNPVPFDGARIRPHP